MLSQDIFPYASAPYQIQPPGAFEFSEPWLASSPLESPARNCGTLLPAVSRPRRSVYAYCGGGISATIDLFLPHQLGHDALTLYDGSMGEWANDPSLPIETDCPPEESMTATDITGFGECSRWPRDLRLTAGGALPASAPPRSRPE